MIGAVEEKGWGAILAEGDVFGLFCFFRFYGRPLNLFFKDPKFDLYDLFRSDMTLIGEDIKEINQKKHGSCVKKYRKREQIGKEGCDMKSNSGKQKKRTPMCLNQLVGFRIAHGKVRGVQANFTFSGIFI